MTYNEYDYQPSPLIVAAYRDNNPVIKFLGHVVFGIRCGFPLCCVLQFSLERVRAARRNTPMILSAMRRDCHPASDGFTGCEAEFVHCSYHAWRGHDRLTHRTRHNSK